MTPTATPDKRWIDTLERLLAIPATDLRSAMSQASDLIAAAVSADKVDAFLYDPARDTLVALGTSSQPLSELERRHGLDVLPLANGGRAAHAFRSGTTFMTGRLEGDDDELRGIKEVLKVRSTIGVPLSIAGTVRGLLLIASQKPDFFTAEDARFVESLAGWLGLVAHRAELMEEIARSAAQQGRQAAAEELITILAHDLRNYIAPLQFRLELLQRRAETEARERDHHDLGLALKGLLRLTDLITDILDAARIEQGIFKLELRPVELVTLLRDAASAIDTPEHPVTVHTTLMQLTVPGDPARIRQCVANLLSNAVKHSPRLVPVRVSVWLEDAHDREWALIAVEDQGPGIAADVLPHVFTRFVTRRATGLGLGLYLAKRIATAHGGDLTVQSEPGKGARFTICLPCDPEAAQATPAG